jgi:hypothetical protein
MVPTDDPRVVATEKLARELIEATAEATLASRLDDQLVGAALMTTVAHVLKAKPPEAVEEWCRAVQGLHARIHHGLSLEVH